MQPCSGLCAQGGTRSFLLVTPALHQLSYMFDGQSLNILGNINKRVKRSLFLNTLDSLVNAKEMFHWPWENLQPPCRPCRISGPLQTVLKEQVEASVCLWASRKAGWPELRSGAMKPAPLDLNPGHRWDWAHLFTVLANPGLCSPTAPPELDPSVVTFGALSSS